MRLTQDGIRGLLDDEVMIGALMSLRAELDNLYGAMEGKWPDGMKENMVTDAKRTAAAELYGLLQKINHNTRRGLSGSVSEKVLDDPWAWGALRVLVREVQGLDSALASPLEPEQDVICALRRERLVQQFNEVLTHVRRVEES